MKMAVIARHKQYASNNREEIKDKCNIKEAYATG
jgi:hypothetical protein